MRGLDGRRVYLDWNATAPLRPEAQAAMLAAMDVVGNPSSVHAEGRAARRIVETARAQVAALSGCEPGQIVFTSGATEANNMAVSLGDGSVFFAADAHESIAEAAVRYVFWDEEVPLAGDGTLGDAPEFFARTDIGTDHHDTRLKVFAGSPANGETGLLTDLGPVFAKARAWGFLPHADLTQALGRVEVSMPDMGAVTGSASAHKMGGPKGVGCYIVDGSDLAAPCRPLLGGGQEQGRRSGTENVIGIAGFGAAAEAARRDLQAGVWDHIARLRDSLEDRLAAAAPDTIFIGKEAPRLPNTACLAVPGWTGETQVMQMDLAGFAVSAGSACSSGKVSKASRVLLAMGFDETTASSAIRVSMGPTTTEAEVMAFADAWIDHYRRRKARAA